MLVISCGALGLATPVAIMVGTGVGAKRHAVQSAEALENLHNVNAVIMDRRYRNRRPSGRNRRKIR
ncbi:MAG: hypothetical protein ACLT4C_07190 [Butyricicoccus sp.]